MKQIETMDEFKIPYWLPGNCPVYDWCDYKGTRYFAVLNWEESERRQKPVLDLAYCATKTMNNIFLIQRVFNKHFSYKRKP